MGLTPLGVSKNKFDLKYEFYILTHQNCHLLLEGIK